MLITKRRNAGRVLTKKEQSCFLQGMDWGKRLQKSHHPLTLILCIVWISKIMLFLHTEKLNFINNNIILFDDHVGFYKTSDRY